MSCPSNNTSSNNFSSSASSIASASAQETSTVDAIIDIKKDNKITLGGLICLLKKIQGIFKELKTQSILLEESISLLRIQIENEGYDVIEYSPTDIDAPSESFKIPYCSSVAQYNTLIQQFLLQVSINIENKAPSDSGLSINAIRPWSSQEFVFVHNIAYKMQAYNWINFMKACVVDNMLVSYPEGQILPCVTDNCSALIHVGCCAPPIYLVRSITSILNGSPTIANTDIIYDNFKSLLTVKMPGQLHRLNALFNKNIFIIQCAIDNINHLIETNNLY